MRCMSGLAAAGLAMVTVGCGGQSGYPTTYSYNPGYGSSSGNSGYSSNYVGLPTYARPAPTDYSSPPPPQPTPPQSTYSRPSTRDDEPDSRRARYGRDRDRNGDGIPDRYQYKNPDPPRSILYTDAPDPRRSILGPSRLQDPRKSVV